MDITSRPTEVLETAHADGTHAVVVGRYRTCEVAPSRGGSAYLRLWHDGRVKQVRRYHTHATYQEAIDAAMAWANRK